MCKTSFLAKYVWRSHSMKLHQAGSHQASSLDAKDYKEPTIAFGHKTLLRSTGTWYWMAWMNRAIPACYEDSNTLFCRNIGQPVMVSGSFCKPHGLPDLCGYLWIVFLCHEEGCNTEQFLSYFWPFASDFKYPLIFFTVFSNSGRLTKEKWICVKYRGIFIDHVPSVVLYILV